MKKAPFVLHGTTRGTPDLFYATRFDAPDPVTAVRFPDGSVTLLVGRMEFARASRQARNCSVESADTLALTDAERASNAGLLSGFLRLRGVGKVEIPPSFPAGVERCLNRRGIETVVAESSPFSEARIVKSAEEIALIKASQRAAKAAARALGEAIAGADVARDGALRVGGKPFTSERARELVRGVLLARGAMDFDGTIVAGGAQAADPHEEGKGPLRSGELIVADIFPRSLSSGYWGDLTRTFFRGTLAPERRRLLATVRAAQKLALGMVKPGASGADVHAAVERFFETRGYRSGVDESGRAYGYFHGTGHGVGLEIHEAPRLSRGGGVLKPGMIVTVEPGLYYPEIGGARWEDTVVVTDTGCKPL